MRDREGINLLDIIFFLILLKMFNSTVFYVVFVLLFVYFILVAVKKILLFACSILVEIKKTWANEELSD